MRHRFITEVGESYSNVIKPTPPDPSQRPTNTNLFTVLNSEQQPEPNQLPSDNDVEEMSSVGFKGIKEKVNAKKQEKRDIENARYHSITDNFNKKDKKHFKYYYELLQKYNELNPSEKPDYNFHDKRPSKQRYKNLIQILNKLEKN